MQLPLIGLGTWELRGDECTQIVQLALELGYRHIDTAHVYQNHMAIRKALQRWNRDKIYLTSKIAIKEQVDLHHVEASVQKACEEALKELGTDYLDLYLIHAPHREYPLDRIFLALESLITQGKVHKVGVSNYTQRHLEDLRKSGGTPFANQVEFHPYLYQKELWDYCKSHQIQLVSFRPFGKGKLLADDPIFEEIGSAHQKTGAQVILRWLVQKGIPVIPKASSEKHLKQNLEIFDFALTAEEMKRLDHCHQTKRYCKPDNPEYRY